MTFKPLENCKGKCKYKTDNVVGLSNNRKISVQSYFSKILERLMNDRSNKYLLGQNTSF